VTSIFFSPSSTRSWSSTSARSWTIFAPEPTKGVVVLCKPRTLEGRRETYWRAQCLDCGGMGLLLCGLGR
jgi:hypothetical protein